MAATIGALLLGLTLGAAAREDGPAREAQAAELRQDATVSWGSVFPVAVPAALVRSALDDPMLMAALWTACGKTPRYRLSAEVGDQLHVVDPTGLAGDLWPLSSLKNRRRYLVRGEIDHWAAPGWSGAEALVELSVAGDEHAAKIVVRIDLRPTSRVGRLVAGVASSAIGELIDRRAGANARDAVAVLEDIRLRPAEVSARLTGADRERFEGLFLRVPPPQQ